MPIILHELHSGVGGGHFSSYIIVKKKNLCQPLVANHEWDAMNNVEPMICAK